MALICGMCPVLTKLPVTSMGFVSNSMGKFLSGLNSRGAHPEGAVISGPHRQPVECADCRSVLEGLHSLERRVAGCLSPLTSTKGRVSRCVARGHLHRITWGSLVEHADSQALPSEIPMQPPGLGIHDLSLVRRR